MKKNIIFTLLFIASTQQSFATKEIHIARTQGNSQKLQVTNVTPHQRTKQGNKCCLRTCQCIYYSGIGGALLFAGYIMEKAENNINPTKS